jgi:hypothetical protein
VKTINSAKRADNQKTSLRFAFVCGRKILLIKVSLIFPEGTLGPSLTDCSEKYLDLGPFLRPGFRQWNLSG